MIKMVINLIKLTIITTKNQCKVCYLDFDEKETKAVEINDCKHKMICHVCFQTYLQTKIKDEDVVPWILCCAENCKQPIHQSILIQYLTLTELYCMARTFLRKHLARNPNWIQCQTKDCQYGWKVLEDDDKERTLECAACKKKHTVSKNPLKNDPGFQDLLKQGTVKLCPKCQLPTMRDKGMCNIMHCGKCGIYWNWRTLETGHNSGQLKNRARLNHTLWEPGELAYQQDLQRSNLPEFIKLLERNGIKYDPNYRRGH